jgi:hypothetical protein
MKGRGDGDSDKPWSEWRAMSMGTGLFVGGVAALPALLLAAISGGGGHGDYGFAWGFFPLPMCMIEHGPAWLGSAPIWLACAQFPLYGAILGYCTKNLKTFGIAILSLALSHLIAFAACSS